MQQENEQRGIPMVSVIMPVYNASAYLDMSIGSVMAQSYADWELVCFNDASTDDSLKILQSYAGRDKRVRVIDSPVNVKQGAGRNRAIEASRGEYVMFLDADDTLRSDALELCVAAAESVGADLVMFDYREVPGREVKPLGAESDRVDVAGLRELMILHPSPIWSGMYRRRLFAEQGLFFPERVFYEDNAVALPLQLSAERPVKLGEALYEYHIYDTSVCHRRNDYRFFHRLNSAVTLKRHLERLGMYDEAHREYFDFTIYRQYFVHTIYGCVYRFDRVPVLRHRYVLGTVDRVVPNIKSNRYYRAQPWREHLKLRLHCLAPRLINALWRLKGRL